MCFFMNVLFFNLRIFNLLFRLISARSLTTLKFRDIFERSSKLHGIQAGGSSVHLEFSLSLDILGMDKRLVHRDLVGSEVSSLQSS